MEGLTSGQKPDLIRRGPVEWNFALKNLSGKATGLVGKKLAELEATLALFKSEGAEPALKLMNTGIGRRTMVQIRAEASGGRLRLSVTDDGADGAGHAAPKLGLGLENVRGRLELIYGKSASLTCVPRQPQGFVATVDIPLERA